MTNEKGLGLGSQICQLLALMYLDELDHYIKEQLHPDVFVRYNDDIVMVFHRKCDAFRSFHLVEDQVEKLGLKLNKKTTIHPLKQGIKFLKWTFILADTGKVLMLMNSKKVTKQRRRLRKLWAKEIAGEVLPGTTRESLRCFLASAKQGDTDSIRKDMIKFYTQLTGEHYTNNRRKVAHYDRKVS